MPRTVRDDNILIDLGDQLERAWSERRRVDRSAGSKKDRAASAYAHAANIVRQIHALPASSLEGLRVKARAISWCHRGEKAISLSLASTTDVRLAKSIIADLCRLQAH